MSNPTCTKAVYLPPEYFQSCCCWRWCRLLSRSFHWLAVDCCSSERVSSKWLQKFTILKGGLKIYLETKFWPENIYIAENQGQTLPQIIYTNIVSALGSGISTFSFIILIRVKIMKIPTFSEVDKTAWSLDPRSCRIGKKLFLVSNCSK